MQPMESNGDRTRPSQRWAVVAVTSQLTREGGCVEVVKLAQRTAGTTEECRAARIQVAVRDIPWADGSRRNGTRKPDGPRAAGTTRLIADDWGAVESEAPSEFLRCQRHPVQPFASASSRQP